MLKEKIKYENFDGVEIEETFYFNLTQAEVIELEASIEGGLSQWIQTISAPKSPGLVIDTFKKMLAKSYGEKTPDGSKFIKNETLSSSFFASAAYSVLFSKLIQDAEYAAYFVNNLLHKPKNADQPTQAQQSFSQSNAPAPTTIQVPTPAPQPTEQPTVGAFGQTEPAQQLSPEEAQRAENIRIARQRAEEMVQEAERTGQLGQRDFGGNDQ